MNKANCSTPASQGPACPCAPAQEQRDRVRIRLRRGLRTVAAEPLMPQEPIGNGHDPEGPEFGEYGVCQVRFGKATRGWPPKRRSVLAVWPWAAEVLQQWAEVE
jgi:integrase/recombinase XerC